MTPYDISNIKSLYSVEIKDINLFFGQNASISESLQTVLSGINKVETWAKCFVREH